MLYERKAIPEKSYGTIKNERADLNEERKMSLDMFCRDPYILDFFPMELDNGSIHVA